MTEVPKVEIIPHEPYNLSFLNYVIMCILFLAGYILGKIMGHIGIFWMFLITALIVLVIPIIVENIFNYKIKWLPFNIEKHK